MQVALNRWLAFFIAIVTEGDKDFEKASIHHLLSAHRKWLHNLFHNFDILRKKDTK